MTRTEQKAKRKAGLYALAVGDPVRVLRVGDPEFVALATVVKVLARVIRVAWAEVGHGETTDFTRDAGVPVGNRRWTGFPVIEPAA